MEAASNKIVHRDEIRDDAFPDSADIPEKYIRTDEVSAGAVVGEDEVYELPIIDMAKLLDPVGDGEAWLCVQRLGILQAHKPWN
ncbi:unnamed protein product [Urochloa humidicola]